MSLPKFDGDIREYPRFRDDFISQVVLAISNSQQSYVLKSCLSGKPLDIVKKVDHNIDEMCGRLDDKYGELIKVIDCIMKDVRLVREVENSRFIQFVDTIEKSYRDLERLDLEMEVSNASTVSLIE